MCPLMHVHLFVLGTMLRNLEVLFYLSVKMSLVYRGCDLERASNSRNLSLNSIESNDEKYQRISKGEGQFSFF